MRLARALKDSAHWIGLLGAFLVLLLAGYLTQGPMQAVADAGVASTRLLDLQLGYSPEYVAQLMGDLGRQGRRAYLTMIAPDLLLPAAFAVTLCLAIALGLRGAHPGPWRWDLLVFLPFAAAAFDYLENAMTLMTIATYPDQASWFAVVGSFGTTLKWALLVLSVGVAVAFAIAARVKSARRRA